MDGWKRCLELSDLLSAMGCMLGRQRDVIEKGLLLCEGVAVATDRLQQDSASAVVLVQV